MNFAETGTTIAQIAGLLAAAIIAAIFGLQKLMKGWNETSIENSVMTKMHKELERLSAQNTLLGEELGKFQSEVIKLNNQLSELTVENNRLHREVMRLTEEVASLQGIVARVNEVNKQEPLL